MTVTFEPDNDARTVQRYQALPRAETLRAFAVAVAGVVEVGGGLRAAKRIAAKKGLKWKAVNKARKKAIREMRGR